MKKPAVSIDHIYQTSLLLAVTAVNPVSFLLTFSIFTNIAFLTRDAMLARYMA